jgi:hypothetical protein
MARTCTVCTHHRRDTMDKALLRGEQLKSDAALRAIHERLAVVELEAKLSGQIDTSPKNVTINVQAISPEEAIEYAHDVLELFGASASTPSGLPAPVIEADEMTLRGQCNGN